MKQWLYFENKQTKKQQTESLNEIGQWDWKLKQNSVGSSTASYPLLGWNTEVLLYFVQSILKKKKKIHHAEDQEVSSTITAKKHTE